MHPDNPYNTRPDFSALAAKYEGLAPYVKDGHLDFQDASALRALTTALLKEDFGLDVRLRDDRLCPTVANRLDYVLLCLDLVPHSPPQSQSLRALDIGTGHVAIYALLLHRLRPAAHITATELDAISLAHAKDTVAANLAPADSGTVEVIPAPEGRILPPFTGSFTLCNPPFFASSSELAASRELKSGHAPAAPTCSENEEITRGGEEAFVGQMVDESAALAREGGEGGPVAWYTSLVGRYESLHSLVKRVKGVTDNYYVVSLRQARTARWVLIWGFERYRLPDTLTRPRILDPTTSFARLLPPPNSWRVRPEPQRSSEEMEAIVRGVLRECGLTAEPGPEDGGDGDDRKKGQANSDIVIRIAPMANTWSRAARRAAQRTAKVSTAPSAEDASTSTAKPEPLFRGTLRITNSPSSAVSASTYAIDASESAAAAASTAEEEGVNGAAQTVSRDSEDGATGNSGAAELVLEWTWGADRGAIDAFWKFMMSKTGLMKRPREREGEAAEEVGVNGSGGDEGRGRGGWRGRGRGGRGGQGEGGRGAKRGRGWRGAARDGGWAGRASQ